MADVPDAIVLKRDRDLDGREHEIWVRRALLGLVVAVPVIALFNTFGQRPDTHLLVGPAASLKIYAPARLRGGLLYEARFHITARRDLENAVLVLDPGWLEGMSVNTIEPSPVGEGSHDGRLTLTLGHVPRGSSYLLFMQFQVNPTNVGRRSQTVELYDRGRKLATVHRTITVWP